jgi:hypothetical protein
MSLRDKSGTKATPFVRLALPVPTQPFAFYASPKDAESVKMSKLTRSRTSGLPPGLPASLAARTRLKRAPQCPFLFDTNEKRPVTQKRLEISATNRQNSPRSQACGVRTAAIEGAS